MLRSFIDLLLKVFFQDFLKGRHYYYYIPFLQIHLKIRKCFMIQGWTRGRQPRSFTPVKISGAQIDPASAPDVLKLKCR